MGLIRSLITLSILGVFIFAGYTIPLGERTLFGHIGNIWDADETQELVEGVKESSEPLVKRVKKGVKAGLAEDDADPPQDENPQP